MDVPAHHNPPTTDLPAVARIDLLDNRALLTCDEELVHRNIIADKSARQMIAATRRALDVKATPTVATERSLLLYPANRHGGYVAFGVGDLTAATHLTITVPGSRSTAETL